MEIIKLQKKENTRTVEVEDANMFVLKVPNILYLCRQPPRQSLDGYKHVVDVKYCPPVPSDEPQFPPEAAKAKETAQHTQNSLEFHEIMEGNYHNQN